ncbi:uncharacterized protein LOC126682425 [Mercurialis annua]|uniref:uncharacterized protein LOC126682425 n=1 Tax=Mercurialis annua TaxID=3986 RepID=UPI00215E45F4|nr:uncharacterized protein LOC126682425 [Mercurialis annua]
MAEPEDGKFKGRCDSWQYRTEHMAVHLAIALTWELQNLIRYGVPTLEGRLAKIQKVRKTLHLFDVWKTEKREKSEIIRCVTGQLDRAESYSRSVLDKSDEEKRRLLVKTSSKETEEVVDEMIPRWLKQILHLVLIWRHPAFFVRRRSPEWHSNRARLLVCEEELHHIKLEADKLKEQHRKEVAAEGRKLLIIKYQTQFPDIDFQSDEFLWYMSRPL